MTRRRKQGGGGMTRPAKTGQSEPNDAWDWRVRVIRDLGFPIFVAAYLLIQVTPTVQKLQSTLDRIVFQQEQLLQELTQQRRQYP